jgi:hypothetical protein
VACATAGSSPTDGSGPVSARTAASEPVGAGVAETHLARRGAGLQHGLCPRVRILPTGPLLDARNGTRGQHPAPSAQGCRWTRQHPDRSAQAAASGAERRRTAARCSRTGPDPADRSPSRRTDWDRRASLGPVGAGGVGAGRRRRRAASAQGSVGAGRRIRTRRRRTAHPDPSAQGGVGGGGGAPRPPTASPPGSSARRARPGCPRGPR